MRINRYASTARPGFSLADILAVVVVLGVLVLIVLPRISATSSTARKSQCHTQKGNVDIQVQLWYREKAVWPQSNLADIGANTQYFPEGLMRCPVDGTSYVLDATTHQVQGHTH